MVCGRVAGEVFAEDAVLSDWPPDAGNVGEYGPLEASVDVGAPDTACVGAAAPAGVAC